MAIEIKLWADYGCWPLWYIEDSDNIDPNELPLSKETINRLNAWQDTYDATLNQEYPPLSAFENPETEEMFQLEGISLWKQLRIELFPESEVFYQRGTKLFRNPVEMNREKQLEFTEVWVNFTRYTPLVLILMSDQAGYCYIYDPAQNYHSIFSNSTYDQLKSWLQKNEYEKVDHRLKVDQVA